LISKRKNILIGLFLTFTLFIIVSVSTSIKPLITSEPPDFYGTSKEVSLEEMMNVASNYDISIYLPTFLPNDLKLTAIYLKESPFIAILVYSSVGNKDYKSAELTLEIAPTDPKWIPTFTDLQSEAEKSQDKTALQINSWSVLIQENAEAYGKYTMLINMWIDEVNYLYNAPTLTVQDAIGMLESTQLVSVA
jgi:hypothetical protein